MNGAQWRRRRWTELTWHERWLLGEAAGSLAFARGAVLTIPFRKIAPRLGDQPVACTTSLSSAQVAQAQQVGWAVRALARFTPWDSNCLAQAVAAKMMLRRRRIPSTLYLGVAKNPAKAKQFEAHAWVTCGDDLLTGAAGHEHFSVIATFGDSDPRQ